MLPYDIVVKIKNKNSGDLVANLNFWVMITGYCYTPKYRYPEVVKFPGNNTQTFLTCGDRKLQNIEIFFTWPQVHGAIKKGCFLLFLGIVN